MSFTYRENRNSPLTWGQLDGNFREVESAQAEASNQALAAAASAETANQASESASLSSGQAEDYASLAEEMARISVVRWCGNHEEAPSTRLDGSPLQISDEYGNLSDNLRYNWTGTSWVALNSSAQELEARLASDDGSGKVGFIQDGLGALGRTALDKQRERVSVKDFGAIGDGVYRPVSDWYLFGSMVYRGYSNLAEVQVDYPNVTIASQSIDWAAIQHGSNICADLHKMLFFGSGDFVMNETYVVPESLVTDADGAGEWLAWTPVFPKKNAPCQLRYIGTGERKWRLPLVSDNRTSGGVVVNLSRMPLDDFDSHYRLTSFKNEDGTDRLFSCAVKTARSGRGIQMANMRIVLDYNGVAGYNDTVSTALGADWDVGLWNESAQNFIAYNVHSVGLWRMYGSLQTAVIDNDDATSGSGLTGSEYSRYLFCNFQGAVGVGIRGGDTYKVTGVGAGYIEVEEAPNLPFHASPTGRMRAGGSETSSAIFSYSAVTVVGLNLRLTVAESTAAVAVGGVVIANVYGFGISNTVYQDCEISPFSHPTGRRATQVGLTKPSAGVEGSGAFLRGVAFRGSKIIGHDDVAAHFHNIADVSFEGQAVMEAKVDSITGTVGMRVIASPTPSLNTRVANPMGQTDRVRMEYVSSITNTAIDLRPYSGLAAPSRFNGAGDNGFFSWQSGRWMDKQFPMDRTNTIMQPPSGGSGIIRDAGGTSRVVVSPTDLTLRDGAGATRITVNAAGTQVRLNAAGTEAILLSGGLRPAVDAGMILGSNTFRFSDIFLLNAPTVTSDERVKADISGVADSIMDAWEAVQYQQYRNVPAVELKGGSARYHIGVMAQRVYAAFENAGIDPFKYGLLCHAEWDDTPEIINEEGEIEQHFRAAGELFMVRYEEALCLEAAVMRRKSARDDARMGDMELRLLALEQLTS